MEGLATRFAHRLIFDNQALAHEVEARQAQTRPLFSVIPYGALRCRPKAPDPARVRWGSALEPGRYLLVVCRFEPENHLLEIARACARTAKAVLPLVDRFAHRGAAARGRSKSWPQAGPLVRFIGPVYDPTVVLRALRYHCQVYLHGHSVGGHEPLVCWKPWAPATSCWPMTTLSTARCSEKWGATLGRKPILADKLWDLERMSERQRRLIGDGARDRVVNFYHWNAESPKQYLQLLNEQLREPQPTNESPPMRHASSQ